MIPRLTCDLLELGVALEKQIPRFSSLSQQRLRSARQFLLKEQYLNLVLEESRRFFMKYYRSGGDSIVIRTRLDHVVYCMPGAYSKVRLSMDQIRK